MTETPRHAVKWPEEQDSAPLDLRRAVDALCEAGGTADLQAWLNAAGCYNELVVDGDLGLVTTRALAAAYRSPDHVAALAAWITDMQEA